MGACHCSSSRKNHSTPSRAENYHTRSTAMEEDSLREKIYFQKQWEDNHSVRLEVNNVWQLSKNIGILDISKFYEIDRVAIGTGHYGVVRKARLKQEPSKIYAVKTIEKVKLKGNFNILRNEFEILRSVDHPYVNQFYEIFQDEKYYHFVLEYCEGGDVTTRIEKQGPMSERAAKNIIFQTLQAISHLHSCSIVHRDIKPDNFLFKSKKPDSPVKLIDFGLSKRLPESGKLTSFLGTPYYVAPEVLEKKPYDFKCDSWSIGIMMYLIMSGKFPFQGSNNQETFLQIKKQHYNLEVSQPLRNLSEEGKDFLAHMLEKNPEKRFSVREALRHPWFKELNLELNSRGKIALTRNVLERLRTFRTESRLVKEVIRLLVIIHNDAPEIKVLKDAFFYLDILNSGVITREELKRGFEDAGLIIPNSEINEIIKGLELRLTNVITFTEFVTACVDQSFYSNRKYLEEAFHRFDQLRDNFLSYSDISDCFARFGVDLPREEVMKMIAEMDSTRNCRISLEEFISVMSKNTHSNIPVPLKKVPDSSPRGILNMHVATI